MATPVIMPRQGQSVESCILAKWHKKKGDKVNEGDFLFTYETGKATFDEESSAEGILLDMFFEEGDDIPVLTNVCVIGEEGEDTSQFNPNSSEEQEAESQQEKTERAISQVVRQYQKANEEQEDARQALETKNYDTNQKGINEEDIIKISPRARNLAERSGVDYRNAVPTGAEGRIIERDINTLIESGKAVSYAARDEYFNLADNIKVEGTGIGGRVTTVDLQSKQDVLDEDISAVKDEYAEVKLTNIRKVIAKAMYNSLSSTAQLTLNASFDATSILNFRKKLKENKERMDLENITINDIILFAVSRTLLKHKELNAHLIDDKMLIFNNVHLGVAVDTERGLMVPTLFNSNLKSLNDIAKQSKALIEQCQTGTINPDYLKGGTFTITNLGTLGIESFTPVLNPPQTGILGVNTIVQAVKQVDGEYIHYPSMGLSLTFDHRALDGAPAAKFLQQLKFNLENFETLLVK